VIRLDGLRVISRRVRLARASNTTPVVVLRFEADDQAAGAHRGGVRRVLLAAKPDAKLPF